MLFCYICIRLHTYKYIFMKKNYFIRIAVLTIVSLGMTIQLQAQTTTWTGTTSADWHVAGNWNNGVPTSSTTVIIADVTTQPIISSGTTALANNLTINTDATLTINTANALTVSGNLTVTDHTVGDPQTYGLILNSGSSLIVQGTSSGQLTYARTITTTNKWHLVANPLVGANDNFLNLAGDGFGFIPQGGVGGTQFGIGIWNHASNIGGWTYSQLNMTSGFGFAVLTSKAGDLRFIGAMPTENYSANTFDTPNNYYIYGNPYPSYLNINSNADATHNLLTVNTALSQDELATATIWVWNAASGTYDAINQADGAAYLAPGQGFFLKTKGGFGDSNIDFTENMQSHQSSETFYRTTTTRPGIKLKMTNGSDIRIAKIYYITGKTKGYENGYDSPIFEGEGTSFALYSSLLNDSEGEKLAIQTLPNTDYEDMVIPIGVNASTGKDLVFTAETSHLPEGIEVNLEDREKGSYTRLDETNSKYTVALTEVLNGVGRFYLHTKTAAALEVNSESLANVSIYKTSDTSLRMIGLPQGNTNVKMFNILGKQLLNTAFQSNGVKDLSLPTLASGIYIVQLSTTSGKLSKKIIID